MLTMSMTRLAAPFASALAILTLVGCSSLEYDPGPKERRVLLEMRARLRTLPEGAQRATIWLPTPRESPEQQRGALKVSAIGGDSRGGHDAWRNEFVSVTGTPSEAQPLEIFYRVEVTRRGRRAPEALRSNGALPVNSPWLVPARNADVPDLRRQVLLQIARIPTIDGRVLALWQHTLDELTLSAPPPSRLASSRYGEGVLPWILEEKVGDSIDFATFFVTHCQAAGIPAAFELGYRLPANEQLESYRPESLHAWACLDLPEVGRIPFDPARAEEDPGMRNAYFGGLDCNRIQMTRGRDLQLNPPLQGEPLNFLGWPVARAGKIDLTKQLEVEIRIQDL